MKHRMLLGAALAAALATGYAVAKEALKSGPQPGDRIPGAFNVLNATNAELPRAVDKKTCLV